MRRLIAIALAAGPLAAEAQTAGQVLFDTSVTATINRTQCLAADPIDLAWQVTMVSTLDFVAATGEFDVYTASQDKTDGVFPNCYYDGNQPNGVTAALVAGLFANPASVLGAAPGVSTNEMVVKAGFDCIAADKTVYVCVVWKNAAGTVKAYAKGSMKLQVAVPEPPVVRKARAGNQALYATIDAGPRVSGDVAATTFKAKAVASVCPTTCDTTPYYSAETAIGSEARIGGLTNDLQYKVTAFAYADNGNVSDESAAYVPANAGEVTPRHVRDMWDEYVAAEGRDSGGCDAGPAGLLALLGAAALLRLRRRS